MAFNAGSFLSGGGTNTNARTNLGNTGVSVGSGGAQSVAPSNPTTPSRNSGGHSSGGGGSSSNPTQQATSTIELGNGVGLTSTGLVSVAPSNPIQAVINKPQATSSSGRASSVPVGRVDTTPSISATPSSISAAPSLSQGYSNMYSMSGMTALGMTVQNIRSNIAGTFTGGQTNWKDTFRPFDYTGQAKSDSTAYFKTTIPNTTPTTSFDFNTKQINTDSSFTPITYKTVQEKTEFNRYKGLQDTKNTFSSQVTPTTTTEQLAEINKNYAVAQQKVWNANQDVQGYSTTSGRTIVANLPEIGKTVGLTALSFAGPVGLYAAGTYALAEGGSRALNTPISNQNPNATGMDYFKERASGVAEATGGIFGIKVAGAMFESRITNAELNSLSKQPFISSQVQYNVGEDKSLVMFKGYQTAGGLTKETTGYGVVVKEGNNAYVLPKGPVETRTFGKLGENIWSDTPQVISSVERGNFGVKGLGIENNGLTFTASRTTYEPQIQATAISGYKNGKMVDVSTNVKLFGDTKTSYSLTGSKEIQPDMYGNQQFVSAGFGIENGRAVKPLQFGVTKVVNSQPQFDMGLTGGSGKSPFTVTKVPSTRLMKGFGGTTQLQTLSSPVQISSSMSSSSVVTLNGLGRSMTLKGSLGATQTGTRTTTKSYQSLAQLPAMSTDTYSPQTTRQFVNPFVQTTGRTTTTTRQYQIVTPIKIQFSQQDTKQTQQFYGGINPISPATSVPTTFNFNGGLAFPSLQGVGGRMGSRSFKGIGRTKYTPSFRALVQNIQGKAPSSSTGLRPITPGFKWSFSEGKQLKGKRRMFGL